VSGVIYLMRENGELVEMNERGYDTEDLLQGYLADHPDLLAGDQINDVEPRRWLLISREMGVPSEEDRGDRWSADHLFLDQDAIPTIVEVKRSTDTRARREVVAQMLDYAANGVMYWPLERLRSTFEANCRSQDHDPETTLLGSLGLELDPEEFWQRAATNLQAGKVRLIFVADKIPSELRRIVEFLNEQMNPAEVLAIEIKQHVAEDFKAFVPRVIGQTAQAERTKSVGTGASRQWDEESFFKELEAKAPEAVKPARAILEWTKNSVNRVTWGKGAKYGTLKAMLDHQGSAQKLLEVWTDGNLYIQLGDPQTYTLLGEESKRSELLLRLDEVPGISFSDQAKKKWGYLLLTPLNDEAALKQFLEVLDWFVQEVKAT
jgi:hypothetical protein